MHVWQKGRGRDPTHDVHRKHLQAQLLLQLRSFSVFLHDRECAAAADDARDPASLTMRKARGRVLTLSTFCFTGFANVTKLYATWQAHNFVVYAILAALSRS